MAIKYDNSWELSIVQRMNALKELEKICASLKYLNGTELAILRRLYEAGETSEFSQNLLEAWEWYLKYEANLSPWVRYKV